MNSVLLMIPKLQNRFDGLEKSRQGLMEMLDQLDEAQLKFQPQPGKWSIIQVLHHVQWSEQGACNYMLKKNRAETLPKSGISSALRSVSLKIALWLPIKYKAPVKAIDPDPNLSYTELKERWESSRKTLKDFLEALPEERTDVTIFRHPFAGYFNIFHVFSFFEDHFQHHLKQIERIRNLENFPQDKVKR